MVKWLFLFLTVIVSFYVLIYYCIIDRAQSEENPFCGNYQYKLKWQACEIIFYPINQLDCFLRPDYLRIGITESGDLIWLDGAKVESN